MISVCMPYHSRYELLQRSVASYEALYDDLELSVCDDRSYVPLELDTRFDSVLSRLGGEPTPKNPCVPINIAVNQSSHELIALTGPEIVHITPVFDQMVDLIDDWDSYVVARCHDPKRGWLVPPSGKGVYPVPEGSGFHFCVMFTRELWQKAGGFDEEYREGQAFDDNDWLWRAHRAGADFKMIDGHVVHLEHGQSKWPKGGWERNRRLFVKKWGMWFEGSDRPLGYEILP